MRALVGFGYGFFACVALLWLALLAQNFYDRAFNPHLPWREGEFEAVTSRLLILTAVFARLSGICWALRHYGLRNK